MVWVIGGQEPCAVRLGFVSGGGEQGKGRTTHSYQEAVVLQVVRGVERSRAGVCGGMAFGQGGERLWIGR